MWRISVAPQQVGWAPLDPLAVDGGAVASLLDWDLPEPVLICWLNEDLPDEMNFERMKSWTMKSSTGWTDVVTLHSADNLELVELVEL